MRAVVMAVVAIGFSACAGCVSDEEAPCEKSATVDGERLTGLQLDDRAALPPSAGQVWVRAAICGRGQSASFTRLRGVPPKSALVYEDTVYMGGGFLVNLPSHPLYELFKDDIHADPGPVMGCRRRALVGRVAEAPFVSKFFTLSVSPGGRLREVTMHPSMTAKVPTVGGLPRLSAGLRVRVRGFACRSGGFYAMRVEQPG